ncbi:MAG TPA: hypothetical protein DCF44_01595 [Chitinophagaceae bacterium]|nr:hypothetical protein [Chitinophagaceae bacterium]
MFSSLNEQRLMHSCVMCLRSNISDTFFFDLNKFGQLGLFAVALSFLLRMLFLIFSYFFMPRHSI